LLMHLSWEFYEQKAKIMTLSIKYFFSIPFHLFRSKLSIHISSSSDAFFLRNKSVKIIQKKIFSHNWIFPMDMKAKSVKIAKVRKLNRREISSQKNCDRKRRENILFHPLRISQMCIQDYFDCSQPIWSI
jgi:hypothetical protein